MRLISISCSPSFAGSSPTIERYTATLKDNIAIPTMIPASQIKDKKPASQRPASEPQTAPSAALGVGPTHAHGQQYGSTPGSQHYSYPSQYGSTAGSGSQTQYQQQLYHQQQLAYQQQQQQQQHQFGSVPGYAAGQNTGNTVHSSGSGQPYVNPGLNVAPVAGMTLHQTFSSTDGGSSMSGGQQPVVDDDEDFCDFESAPVALESPNLTVQELTDIDLSSNVSMSALTTPAPSIRAATPSTLAGDSMLDFGDDLIGNVSIDSGMDLHIEHNTAADMPDITPQSAASSGDMIQMINLAEHSSRSISGVGDLSLPPTSHDAARTHAEAEAAKKADNKKLRDMQALLQMYADDPLATHPPTLTQLQQMTPQKLAAALAEGPKTEMGRTEPIRPVNMNMSAFDELAESDLQAVQEDWDDFAAPSAETGTEPGITNSAHDIWSQTAEQTPVPPEAGSEAVGASGLSIADYENPFDAFPVEVPPNFEHISDSPSTTMMGTDSSAESGARPVINSSTLPSGSSSVSPTVAIEPVTMASNASFEFADFGGFETAAPFVPQDSGLGSAFDSLHEGEGVPGSGHASTSALTGADNVDKAKGDEVDDDFGDFSSSMDGFGAMAVDDLPAHPAPPVPLTSPSHAAPPIPATPDYPPPPLPASPPPPVPSFNFDEDFGEIKDVAISSVVQGGGETGTASDINKEVHKKGNMNNIGNDDDDFGDFGFAESAEPYVAPSSNGNNDMTSIGADEFSFSAFEEAPSSIPPNLPGEEPSSPASIPVSSSHESKAVSSFSHDDDPFSSFDSIVAPPPSLAPSSSLSLSSPEIESTPPPPPPPPPLHPSLSLSSPLTNTDSSDELVHTPSADSPAPSSKSQPISDSSKMPYSSNDLDVFDAPVGSSTSNNAPLESGTGTGTGMGIAMIGSGAGSSSAGPMRAMSMEPEDDPFGFLTDDSVPVVPPPVLPPLTGLLSLSAPSPSPSPPPVPLSAHPTSPELNSADAMGVGVGLGVRGGGRGLTGEIPGTSTPPIPFNTFSSTSSNMTQSHSRAMLYDELQALGITMCENQCYRIAHACFRQAAVKQHLQDLNTRKHLAVQEDKLELAISLRDQITVLSEKLLSSSEEEKWMEEIKRGPKGESIASIINKINLIDEQCGRRCKKMFGYAAIATDLSWEEKSRAAVSAMRSYELIKATHSTHKARPRHWHQVLSRVINIMETAIERLTAFQHLSSTDRDLVMQEGSMSIFMRSVVRVLEVGLWVTATVIEAAAVEAEEMAQKFRVLYEVFVKSKKEWGLIFEYPLPSVEELTCQAVDLTGVQGVTYCNLTLRPVSASSGGREKRISGAAYTDYCGVLYMQAAISLWVHDMSDVPPTSEGTFPV